MKHAMNLAGLGGLAAILMTLSACGDPLPPDEGVEPIGPEVTEPAIPETEALEPLPGTEVPIQPPPTLPTDNRTSEESVRPDSDTLFY
ncbi:MAG: hypothetical protein Q8S53_16540 [Brevundimonas sp.]|uniref:hypothetical protein n=1 Tax=Brevundimonas sp. TaxID=1871086 RepID=UPI0027370E4F|nr:hypothetical protein [Brevundimonas sp.]MDP3379973.1 hypothetical protein [Brevundimonas sp.]